jgi:RimJ/RimL family protein N-acetyltransferase
MLLIIYYDYSKALDLLQLPGSRASRHTAHNCSVIHTMPFDLQPTLTGELVELRPLREDDWAELFAVASDPLIWELHPVRERYKEEIFRKFFRGAIESGGAFAVIDRSTGRIIGSTRYHDYREAEREIEFGWTFLARAYWGGIYNGEMKQLMLQHAFQFVDRVLFFVGIHNWRSQQAIKKIGGLRIDERTDETGRKSYVYEMRKV